MIIVEWKDYDNDRHIYLNITGSPKTASEIKGYLQKLKNGMYIKNIICYGLKKKPASLVHNQLLRLIQSNETQNKARYRLFEFSGYVDDETKTDLFRKIGLNATSLSIAADPARSQRDQLEKSNLDRYIDDGKLVLIPMDGGVKGYIHTIESHTLNTVSKPFKTRLSDLYGKKVANCVKLVANANRKESWNYQKDRIQDIEHRNYDYHWEQQVIAGTLDFVHKRIKMSARKAQKLYERCEIEKAGEWPIKNREQMDYARADATIAKAADLLIQKTITTEDAHVMIDESLRRFYYHHPHYDTKDPKRQHFIVMTDFNFAKAKDMYSKGTKRNNQGYR